MLLDIQGDLILKYIFFLVAMINVLLHISVYVREIIHII